MVSKDSKRRPRRRSARKKKANSPVFDSKIVTALRLQIDDRWPNLRRRLASLVQVSREKLGDIYSSAAQFITEQKEAIEDRLAEKKTQARAASLDEQQKNAPARPNRRGARDMIKDGKIKSSPVRLPSKRVRSSEKPRS